MGRKLTTLRWFFILILLVPAFGQFQGSTPTGEATATPLSLTLDDAIARGMKTNLGLLTRDTASASARADRLQLLSALLPTVTAGVSMTETQVNLKTFGINFPGVPTVVGPFHYQDARLSSDVTVYDPRAFKAWRASAASLQAAELSAKDARDLVVQAVASAYLQIISTAARVEATKAEVDTAQALYERARDQHRAGTSPAIDELRAQVELKTQQQLLLAQRNQVEKDKLALARAIGLPTGQSFEIATKAPYAPLDSLAPEQAVRQAMQGRADYQSSLKQVKAAEQTEKAYAAGWLPRASINADYGDIGPTLAESHGTFTVTGEIKMDVFDGGRRKADVEHAKATLKQRKDELENLRGQIDQEVRTSLLDLRSASDQVEVAQSNAVLADQTLTQARDRFAAGVTDNIEVVQAQQSVSAAQQNLISAVFAHNIAKVSLARALGATESNLKAFMGGK
jgi:outer membrane protein TolC